MTFIINFLASLLVGGFLGLFMLILTAYSLMEQDRRYNALLDKMEKNCDEYIKKLKEMWEKKWRIITGLLFAGGLKDFYQISLLISLPPLYIIKLILLFKYPFLESWTANPALDFFLI